MYHVNIYFLSTDESPTEEDEEAKAKRTSAPPPPTRDASPAAAPSHVAETFKTPMTFQENGKNVIIILPVINKLLNKYIHEKALRIYWHAVKVEF